MRIFIFCLLIGFQTVINAQEFSCGIPNQSLSEALLLQQRLQQALTRTTSGIQYIPIQFTVFTFDDGTGGVSNRNVNQALAELNRQMAPTAIQFYFKGTTIQRVPNSMLFFGLSESNIPQYNLQYGATDALTIYTALTTNYMGANVGGFTFISPQIQEHNLIALSNGMLSDRKTLLHEIGHYFSLYHTFNNADAIQANDRELVTRNFTELPPRLSANCATSGDFLCDTPADPRGLPNANVSNCTYSGTAVDANGDAFLPLVNNYMDYNFCGPYAFTPEQIQRMQNGLTLVTQPSNEYTLTAPETQQLAPTDVQVAFQDPFLVCSWTDTSTVETGYILEYATSLNGPFVPFQGVEANCSQVSLFNFEAGTYFFRIKPSNSKHNYSNTIGPITVGSIAQDAYSLRGGFNNFQDDHFLSTNDQITYTTSNLVFPAGGTTCRLRKNLSWATSWVFPSFPSGTVATSGSEAVIPQGTYSFTYNSTTGAYQFINPLQVNEIVQNFVAISPNPTEDFLQIKNEKSIDFTVKVFTLQGQQLPVPQQDGVVDLRTLASGIYLLQFQTENAVFIEKIIKK